MGSDCVCGRSVLKSGRLLRPGDILSKDGEQFLVAQVDTRAFLIISIKWGNRWVDGSFTLDTLTKLAKRDGFKYVKGADNA